MRSRTISAIKQKVLGESKVTINDIEVILEDPSGYSNPTALVEAKIRELSQLQAMLDSLAGFDEID